MSRTRITPPPPLKIRHYVCPIRYVLSVGRISLALSFSLAVRFVARSLFFSFRRTGKHPPVLRSANRVRSQGVIARKIIKYRYRYNTLLCDPSTTMSILNYTVFECGLRIVTPKQMSVFVVKLARSRNGAMTRRRAVCRR